MRNYSHWPKWLTVSLTSRLQCSRIETSAGSTMASGEPSPRALSATARRRSSRLAANARRAPLFAYSYAKCFKLRRRKTLYKIFFFFQKKVQNNNIYVYVCMRLICYLSNTWRCSGDEDNFAGHVFDGFWSTHETNKLVNEKRWKKEKQSNEC